MRFDDMTEEQILNETLEVLPNFMARARGNGKFNSQRCLEAAIDNLSDMFKKDRKIGYFDRMMDCDIQKLRSVIEHFTPLIWERVRQAEINFGKSQMKSEILKAKAQAIIAPAFQKASLKADIRYFDKDAKISVRLTGKKWATLFVNYNDISKDGYMNNLISAIKDLRDVVIRIGTKLSVGGRR